MFRAEYFVLSDSATTFVAFDTAREALIKPFMALKPAQKNCACVFMSEFPSVSE